MPASRPNSTSACSNGDLHSPTALRASSTDTKGFGAKRQPFANLSTSNMWMIGGGPLLLILQMVAPGAVDSVKQVIRRGELPIP